MIDNLVLSIIVLWTVTAMMAEELNYQVRGNVLLFPSKRYDPGNTTDPIKGLERLGGLLKYNCQPPEKDN